MSRFNKRDDNRFGDGYRRNRYVSAAIAYINKQEDEAWRHNAALHHSAANLQTVAAMSLIEPIKGFRGWFMISAIPVELGDHARRGHHWRTLFGMLYYNPAKNTFEREAY